MWYSVPLSSRRGVARCAFQLFLVASLNNVCAQQPVSNLMCYSGLYAQHSVLHREHLARAIVTTCVHLMVTCMHATKVRHPSIFFALALYGLFGFQRHMCNLKCASIWAHC